MIRSAHKTLIDPPTRSCHASTMALFGADVLVAWFGGTQEGSTDVDIYAAWRADGIWQRPFLLAGEAGIPHWNPVLFARGGQVDLFYKVGHKIPEWHTRHMLSLDAGRTWSEPVELVEGDRGGRGPVRNKPIVLSSGRILAPASTETYEAWNAFVDISDDGGKGFRKSAAVPLWRRGTPKPEGYLNEPFEVSKLGVIQPTLWQSDDKSVHMLLRSSEGFILRSDSTDEGETWCCAYSTGLFNNNSGIDLVRLCDGRICLVMNPVSGNFAARTPLTLWVSEDDGKSFKELMNLEINQGEYSYPAIIADGNRLYISYTWKREKIAFWELELE